MRLGARCSVQDKSKTEVRTVERNIHPSTQKVLLLATELAIVNSLVLFLSNLAMTET